MGARGKKRRRADGSTAFGKTKRLGPPAIPEVDPAEIGRALTDFRTGVAEIGDEAAYLKVQASLNDRLGRDVGDAVMWRAAMLSDLLEWPDFAAKYCNEGHLPSQRMLEAAAIIPSFGDEKRFDWEEFEAMMDRAAVIKPR